MRKVKAYETTDGQLHKDEGAAREYQNELDRVRGIKAWADRYCYGGMTVSEIADTLINHGEELGI
ncbi:hypothetical protein LCGC14_0957610 [marine sediment metagenome]|uniref:Uncharacterized protein n=1 Tax=marine sediment metagenome TaxID=412755 RepID=A0A0F9P1Q5_9ZZZZ